jgi:hypothetical protein
MRQPLAALCAVVVSLLAWCPSSALEARQTEDTKTLVARTRAYVTDLESKLAYGIFDETYTQSVMGPLRDDSRTMTGELFLTYLPTDQAWIAVHDVRTVDGQPLEHHEDLATLMQRGSIEAIGRDVAEHNASFNIGHISRNFNEPTLPLVALSPRRTSDFAFSSADFRVEDGVPYATLRFEERKDAPKLISSKSGQAFRSHGDFEIETHTGRVHRTHLEFSGSVGGGTIAVSHTTEYAYDKTSNLWVPAVFEERYDGHPEGQPERVTCVAKYTNFRQFQVLGRIK